MSDAAALVLATACTLCVCIAAGIAWWVSWRSRWTAVFDEALRKAFPNPIVRLAYLDLVSSQGWEHSRIENDLSMRTGLVFPEW